MKLLRTDFHKDLMLAEQETYEQGQYDAHLGNASTPEDYPVGLRTFYRNGYDDESEGLI